MASRLSRWLYPGRGLAASALALALGGPALAQSAPDAKGTAPAPAAAVATTSVLDAQRAGDLEVTLRGAGEDRVQMTLTNQSPRRLNVVLPPGLVASAAAGQFQSMGLGGINNRPGSFGGPGAPAITNAGAPGFRSVGLSPAQAAPAGLAIAEGQTIEVTVPSVCLNYGAPTPTARNEFQLVTAEEYSEDPRVGMALKALHAVGTSQKVAQAVMWNVCNGLTFPQMSSRVRNHLNLHEIALAARFVRLMNSSAGDVDPAQLLSGRMFVRIQGEGAWADRAVALGREAAGASLLGLPVTVAEAGRPTADGPALLVNVTLADDQAEGQAKATVQLQFSHGGTNWQGLGRFTFADAAKGLDSARLVKRLDQEIAAYSVAVKTSKRDKEQATIRVENKLPFTIQAATIRAGDSYGAPVAELDALGVGPRREGGATIPASRGAKVERVTLNGL